MAENRPGVVKPGSIGYLMLAVAGVGAIVCGFLLARMLFG